MIELSCYCLQKSLFAFFSTALVGDSSLEIASVTEATFYFCRLASITWLPGATF